MNSFGRIFRVSIFGESHGPCVGVVIDGCPPGLSTPVSIFCEDMKRRMGGFEGATPRKEEDAPIIKSGVYNGKTTGAPVCILFENKDVDSSPYEVIKNRPRPGHADFAAWKKYEGFNDYRGGGHFSGRLTAGLVAAGVMAKLIIKPVRVEASLVEAGGSGHIGAAVRKAMEEGDSIGGMVVCKTRGLPPGLGEPFFDSTESLISHMAFSIPAVKGIEFGAGFSCARARGSVNNDEIINISGETKTNNAGGINGGITNGNEIFFRVAVKPASTIPQMQNTIDLQNGESAQVVAGGRHDACIALRMPVIIEAATAIVLADLMLLRRALRGIGGLPTRDMTSGRTLSTPGEIVEDALAGRLDRGTIFSPDSLAELERVTAKLEYLKHIIREKDQEELDSFSL